MPLVAFVALGSNQGDSQRLVLEGMRRLQFWSQRPLLKSSLWQSSPVDCPPGSPTFVNAVVGLFPRPNETPDTLLTVLQSLEKAFGRQPKKVLNEPRPIDLDLLCFGGEFRQSTTLTLPHPRAHLRRFVLLPLAEIAPDLVWPGGGKTVRALLEELRSDELVVRISSAEFGCD